MSKTQKLGTFELTGSVLRVTDPCYVKIDTAEILLIKDAVPGTWEAESVLTDIPDWGERITNLTVRLKGTDIIPSQLAGQISVSSAKAGCFDNNLYPEGDDSSPAWNEFYQKASEKTLGFHRGDIVDNMGVVVRLGIEDSSRNVLVSRNSENKVIAVSVSLSNK